MKQTGSVFATHAHSTYCTLSHASKFTTSALLFAYHSSVYISMSSGKPPERNTFLRNVFKFAGLARKLSTWRLAKR